MSAAYRPTRFGPVSIEQTALPGGGRLLRSRYPLDAFPDRITEKLLYWAAHTPERIFLARRDAAGDWVTLHYADTLRRVRCIAQFLLELPLSAERPAVILSENSLEHALLSLALLHTGVPYAPISPPYSLIPGAFEKLKYTLEKMTPGLVFVQDGRRYERAVRYAFERFPDAIFVFAQHPTPGIPSPVLFEQVEDTIPTAAVEAAFARTGPDTIAKILFTSGSTDLPKGVVNTQRMWCANLQQISRTFPFLSEKPPVFVDWLPWHHTFGGNHNFGMTLYHGGSLYIDDGKPGPEGIEITLRNLREIAPTTYFNVPRGFEALIPHFQQDADLCRLFFSRLDMIFYAAAGISQAVWDALEALSIEHCGVRVPIISGFGSTESAPSALFVQWPGGRPELLGVPVPGLEVKLTPNADKLEAGYRGPNITPGYWRDADATAAAFDAEGFFKTGDAFRPADDTDPDKGLVFDGRVLEDFKLSTGTWVNVGMLRHRLVSACAPLVQDAVLTGLNRDYVGAILFLNPDAVRRLAELPVGSSDPQVFSHPIVRRALQERLAAFSAAATGSTNRICRAIVALSPPTIDSGEITDKGSINQRAVLANRPGLVRDLYADPPEVPVIVAVP